jgi:hypothetical protein
MKEQKPIFGNALKAIPQPAGKGRIARFQIREEIHARDQFTKLG